MIPVLHSKRFTGQPISTAPGYCFKRIFRSPTQPIDSSQFRRGLPAAVKDHPATQHLAFCFLLFVGRYASLSLSLCPPPGYPPSPLKSTTFHPSVTSGSSGCFWAPLRPHRGASPFHRTQLASVQPADAQCLGLQHDRCLGTQVPRPCSPRFGVD